MPPEFIGKLFHRTNKEKDRYLTMKEYAKLIGDILVNELGYGKIGQCYIPSALLPGCRCYFFQDSKGNVCLVGEARTASTEFDLPTKDVSFGSVCGYEDCSEIKKIESDPKISHILGKKYSGSSNATAFWYLQELTQQPSSPSSAEQS